MIRPWKYEGVGDEFPYAYFTAPLTVRGFVRFVNIRPELRNPQPWICDECFQRVPISRMENHVKNVHGFTHRKKKD